MDGRCQDCGLDNARSKRKNYRLNESYIEKRGHNHKIIEDTWDREDKNAKAQEVNDKNVRAKEKQTVKRMSTAYRATGTQTYQKVKKAKTMDSKKQTKIIWAVIGVAVALIGPVTSFIGGHKEEVQSVETLVEERDPYEYALRELSSEGTEFNLELEPGEYKVGAHLPEGNYKILRSAGRGDVTVDDYENSIYMWQSIGTEEEYGEVQKWEDVRLYQGAIVEVSGDLCIRLETSCAREDSQQAMLENPLNETVDLKKGIQLTAGIDFPAGVYDCGTSSEWTSISYKVPLYTDYEEEELNFLTRSKLVKSDELDSIYHNMVLPEGTVVCSEDADATLSPSKLIESEDYDSYYDEYR